MSESPTKLRPPETPGPPPEPGFPGSPTSPSPRRRFALAAVIAACAVIVLTIPLAVFAVRGTWPWTQSNPAASSTVPFSPSASPTSTGPTSTGPAPDGRISLDQLKNAALDIPAWPADNLTGLSGRLTFVNGEVLSPPDGAFPFERHIIVVSASYGDVDSDGAQETIALIGCYVQAGSEQLVAFDRDADGTIVTMGRVLATTGEVRLIDKSSVRVLDDGTVTVRVGDYQPCCGDPTPVQYQDRAYRWDGHAFSQVGGATAFPVNPSVTETGLVVGQPRFTPMADGQQHGRLAVTVSYLRGTTPDHLSLTFGLPSGLRRDGTAWPPVRAASDTEFTIDLPTPALGTSAEYVFEFVRPVNASGGELGILLRAKTALDKGDDIWLAAGVLSESNPFNGSAQVALS